MQVNVRWTFKTRKDYVFPERSTAVVTERLLNVYLTLITSWNINVDSTYDKFNVHWTFRFSILLNVQLGHASQRSLNVQNT